MPLDARVGLMNGLQAVLELMPSLDPEELTDLGVVLTEVERQRVHHLGAAEARADQRKASEVLQQCLEHAAKLRADRDAPTWRPGR